MQHCDCGCIDEADARRLTSKPLGALEEDDFGAYHGSALYTWGELHHYKHFLPRILEVHHQKRGQGWIELHDIAAKLAYAEWRTWPKEEVAAIQAFVQFLYFHGTALLTKGLKDAALEAAFSTFITQEELLFLLEQTFFDVAETDQAYAEKVSIVLQMIEQA